SSGAPSPSSVLYSAWQLTQALPEVTFDSGQSVVTPSLGVSAGGATTGPVETAPSPRSACLAGVSGVDAGGASATASGAPSVADGPQAANRTAISSETRARGGLRDSIRSITARRQAARAWLGGGR